uniref:Uncharacterized protein n=1 Tax=Alexandrium catenella TaxID=2925 RepID=A0A7S1QLJ9_ALECA
MRWKEVYESGAIACGEGAEFVELEHAFQTNFTTFGRTVFKLSLIIPPGKLVMPHPAYEFCNSGYHKFQHRRCANVRQGQQYSEPDRRTWCYVGSACPDLRGGRLLLPSAPSGGGEGISWKFCQDGLDESLHDVPPRELMENATRWAVESGSMYYYNNVINLGWLMKWAYPLLADQVWADVEPLWKIGARHRLPEAVRRALEGGRPLVIDVQHDGHGSQVVLHGEEAWSLEVDKACPHTVYCYRCLSGCEKAASGSLPHRPAAKGDEL